MNIQPPAQRARRAALTLSAIAVCFAFAFGFAVRHWYAMVHGEVATTLDGDGVAALYLVGALSLALVAMLLRIFAGICELVWLERTWSNLPVEHRRVGPIENVTPVHIFGIAFIPIVAWFWKLALIGAVAKSLELVRKDVPFRAAVPRRLGITACIFGWLPPLNLYVAPFLWEMFARRIDVVCIELAALDAQGGQRSSTALSPVQ